MRSVLPPLLQSDVDRRVNSPAPLPGVVTRAAAVPTGAAELVTLAHRENDDGDALRRIGAFVLQGVRATRVEFWTNDEGPATAVVTSGTGLSTRLGPRALEAGTVIGPECAESGWEIAVPVRLGSRLIGALCARWPADRSPGNALSLLSLAGAVAAPRVESLRHRVREAAQAATAIPELVGVSAAIGEVRRAVIRAAAAPFSVLIEGESGVGKELVARAIHQQSPRRSRRFCDINSAALPDDLFESELFGHARGAFSGAVHDRAGLVEEADGGTLFLDEVADLSARAQAKLLRVVQQQEVRRVGETFSRKVDVRFVSAANRDLRREAEEGRFRHDLLYRLEVIRIRIAPLRERPEDVAPLVRHFWAAASARVNTAATLSHAVLAALARYHWPGNVREVQNVMAALAVEAPVRGQVRAALLPAVITGATTVTSARLNTARLQWERRFVEVALARAGGNRSRAARDLGLTRQGLLKALERLGLGERTNVLSDLGVSG
jgi:DNA-binding NtrC family response regulator